MSLLVDTLTPFSTNGQLRLNFFDKVLQRIAEASSVKELRAVSDGMTALRFCARKAKDRELETAAIELRMRAQRRAGEMLITLKADGLQAKKGRRKEMSSGHDISFVQTLQDLGISRNDSMLWQRIARIPEETFEARIARLGTDPVLSHESDEWLTPMPVLAAATAVMGAIDLDPCAEVEKPPHNVPAARHFSKNMDGLTQLWRGRVFLNPPYSEVDRFTEKLIREWRAGMVEQAIVLVASRTDTRWWRMFQISPVCFVSGRLDFRRPGSDGGINSANTAPFPSAVFYVGPDSRKRQFCAAFAPLGQIRDTVIAG